MMRTSILVGLCVCLAWLWPAGKAEAARVAVLPVEGTNLSADETAAIGALLAQAYEAREKGNVLTPAALTKMAGNDIPAPEAAIRLGAEELVDTSAVKLGTKIQIQSILRGRDGRELWRAQATAASMDDLGEVCDRLAESLFRRQAFAETATMHNITAKEASPENRIYVQTITAAKASVVLPYRLHTSFEPSVALAAYRRMEAQRTFWDFGFGLMLASGTTSDPGLGALQADLGGGYYLQDTSASPYVGGGILPRILWVTGAGSDVTMGLAPYADVGMEFMRQARSGIQVELRVTQNVLPIRVNTEKVRPTEFSLQFAMGF